MADSWWDSRTRPCLDSVSVTSMNLFQETTESTTTTTTSGGDNRGGASGVVGNNPSLRMMELGLSSQPISQPLDWNQDLYRGDQRTDDHQSGYQGLIHEDNSLSSNTNIFQETQWKPHKIYPESPSEFKQMNVRGFRLDERNYNDENGLNPSFQTMDQSYGSNSTIIQSLFGSNNNTNQQHDSCYDKNQGISYSYQSSYGGITLQSGGSGSSGGEYPPQLPHQPQEFLGNSPPKVQSQLQFSNTAQFWNASAASTMDARSSFFPLQMQSPSTIEDKPKNPISEVKKSNTKSSSSAKRPRNENPPLQAFKVRKEKMGDRITALQQLVSPFGKTDTASVLSEAIEYIKFLHEQVNVLSTPYLKTAAIMQQQQISDNASEGSRHDLRSRGLCLVPLSSTFPMTHETTVDFWTPSFGGTFR
ncbi:uncharacterized protein LOC143620445 [Bidens hawaiensis]|uniref:uncharacterized protein LOC143620445 n=1 Tax=Bidens hawaiensis TaxID=980011 RepID=UPI0040495932